MFLGIRAYSTKAILNKVYLSEPSPNAFKHFETSTHPLYRRVFKRKEKPGKTVRKVEKKEPHLDVHILSRLCWLLRKGAEYEGVPIRKDGFVKVAHVLENRSLKEAGLHRGSLRKIVRSDPEKRFEYDFTALFIRATSGHSMENVESDLISRPVTSALDLPRGTATCLLSRAQWQMFGHEGLRNPGGKSIHLVTQDTFDLRTHQILIYVAVQKALDAGIKFSFHGQGKIMTLGDEQGRLSPEFFEAVVHGYDLVCAKRLIHLLCHSALEEGLTTRKDGFVMVRDVLGYSRLQSRRLNLDKLKRLVDNDPKQRFELISESPEGLQLSSSLDEFMAPIPTSSTSTPGNFSTDLNRVVGFVATFTLTPEVDIPATSFWWIRARAGHSMPHVDLKKEPIKSASDIPSGMAIFWTDKATWRGVHANQGLQKKKQIPICLHQNVSLRHITSGLQPGNQVLIYVAVQRALDAGIKFWLSETGVVLTEGNEQGNLSPEFFDRVVIPLTGDELSITTKHAEPTSNNTLVSLPALSGSVNTPDPDLPVICLCGQDNCQHCRDNSQGTAEADVEDGAERDPDANDAKE